MTAVAKKPTHLDRALALRDQLIRLAEGRGRWVRHDGAPPAFIADLGDIRIGYRTPFQKEHVHSSEVAANGLGGRHWPYLLQVWSEHHSSESPMMRVMALEWDPKTGESRLNEFHSGAWEYMVIEHFTQAFDPVE